MRLEVVLQDKWANRLPPKRKLKQPFICICRCPACQKRDTSYLIVTSPTEALHGLKKSIERLPDQKLHLGVTSWYYKNWEEVQWQETLGRNLTCCSSLIDSSILVRLLSCKIFTNLLCLREQHNRQRDQVMRHTSQTMNVYQTRTIKTLRVEHDKRLLLGHHLRMKEKRPDKETPFI